MSLFPHSLTIPSRYLAIYEGAVCMEFSYLLCGQERGLLSVYSAPDSTMNPEHGQLLWREGYYSEQHWQQAYVVIDLVKHHMVRYYE